MNWLPMSVEKRYGAMLHEESVKRKALLTREERIGKELYPIADKLFARVLQGVPQSAYTFELYIRKSNEGNAIALPGGFVYIDSILLQSPKSFPEAHFALSHEVGHVLQRHETRIAQARIIDTLSLAGSAKDLLVTIQDPSKLSDTVLAVAAKGKGIFQKHFEGQELQADACAVRILDTAFDQLADVDAALNAFIQSLAKSTQASGAKPVPVAQVQRTASPNTDDLLQEVGNPIDRHPSFTERVANLGAMRKAIAVQRATGKR